MTDSPIPEPIRHRLDLLAKRPREIADRIKQARRLGARYAAEVWRDQRGYVLVDYLRAIDALNTIADPARFQAVYQYLVSRLPASFVSQAEVQYFTPPAPDIAPLDVPGPQGDLRFPVSR
jgi:hypothetical protein